MYLEQDIPKKKKGKGSEYVYLAVFISSDTHAEMLNITSY